MMGFQAGRAGFSIALCVMTLAVGGFGAPASAQTSQPTPMEKSTLEPLVILNASGKHTFHVEVMRTEAQLEKGLMFQRVLPPDRGMLFDFKIAHPIMMWMKNTYLPLDMIFMSKKGIVTHIARDAKPLSETIIPSEGPAYAVLEVNAGTAKRIALKVGDKVQNEIFEK